jgi:hypothetical protein
VLFSLKKRRTTCAAFFLLLLKEYLLWFDPNWRLCVVWVCIDNATIFHLPHQRDISRDCIMVSFAEWFVVDRYDAVNFGAKVFKRFFDFWTVGAASLLDCSS